jgi:hypothetical protein
MQRNMKPRHAATRVVVTGFRAAVLALVVACSRPPDEDRIRATIEAMKEAAEARRPAGVLDHLTADFTGNAGDVDRAALGRILKLEFLRNEAITVSLGRISIDIDGDRATAKFDLTLHGGASRWLPSGGRTYAVVSGWRRDGGDWICYAATWSTDAP